VSKLEHGFVSDKDLVAQKDLVVKLLDWFNFDTCPEAEKVLNLILRLMKVRPMDYFSHNLCYSNECVPCSCVGLAEVQAEVLIPWKHFWFKKAS
jgi:hypothetical protein